MASFVAPRRSSLHGCPRTMQTPIASHTITYCKPGTHPPVFLAGSFTEPQWVPHEMDYTQDANGEYVYTSRIRAVPGHEYHFKFRVGQGNHWVLDENSLVGTDSMGNKNNLLNVPLKGAPKATRAVPGKVLNELGIVDMDSRASTPIEQVADTAAEVADVAQTLDQDDLGSYGIDEPEYSFHGQDTARTPLFAHESFGAYGFVDDGLDHEALDSSAALSQSISPSIDYALDEVDVNDPTIEKFPSERGSVIDALRKIQSSLGEDQVHVENAPALPRDIGWRSTSIDWADDGHLSPGSISPTSSTAFRRRESRLSYGSFGKTKSATSLSSIAEEPKSGTVGNLAGLRNLKKPRSAVFEGPDTSASDEEGSVKRAEKITRNDKKNPELRISPAIG